MEDVEKIELTILSEVLSCNEIAQVPVKICEKLEDSLKKKIDDFITVKAVFEKNRKNSEEQFSQLTKDCEIVRSALNENEGKLALVDTYASELQSQLEESRGELLKLQESIKILENENTELRKQKYILGDENHTLLSQIERKDIELERLRTELDSYSLQLQNAVTTKCQALAEIEELQSREMSLDFKEKRLEQERILLSQQIVNLEEELSKRTTELQKTRSEMSTHTLLTETRLNQCEEELKIKSEAVNQLREANSILQYRNEDFANKLEDQRNHELSMHSSYREEITAQIRLADLYKGMADESNTKANEYSDAVKELQDLLEHATEQYGLLETKYNQTLLDFEQENFIKQKKIDELVKEIHRANELLRNIKQEKLDQAVEKLAPTAAIASKILKKGLSLTQIYTQLVETSNELSSEREEKDKLKSHMEIILKELEEKAPIIQQQRTDYENALANVATLSLRLDELLTENNRLQRDADEARKLVNHHSKENQRLKCELADLARQVCYLLKEVQDSRISHGFHKDEIGIMDIDGVASSQIISKKLVTFKDIEELQENNQKLLSIVRTLSSKQEEIEKATDEINSGEIKEKLNRYVENLAEMQEAQDRQSKMLEGLLKQRDMYKCMYKECISKSLLTENEISSEKNKICDIKQIPKVSDTLMENIKCNDEFKFLSQKYKDSESKINEITNDFESYKKEKIIHEKMLSDEIERLRKESENSSIRCCRLKTQLDSANERFNVLQGNVANYKSQIKVLEEKCITYSSTIGKHEQSLMILKDETLRAQRQLSKAEVQLENLRQERQLLRDSEGRLLKEREVMHRERHTHSLLKADLEAIKSSLERSQVETQLRTEQRLDDATRECAALRRRLQEEQDRFRELTLRLERQINSAQERLSEEKCLVERIQGELDTSRLTEKDYLKRIDELNSKLKEASSYMTSKSATGDDNFCKKLQALEVHLVNSQAEVKSLTEQLKASRFQCQQYCDIAESAETQFRETTDEYKKTKEKLENDLMSCQEEAKTLQNLVDKLQNNITGLSNNQFESHSELQKQLVEAKRKIEEAAELKRQLELTKSDLKNASAMAAIAEEKYTREMILHSTDLQTCSKVKEELNITVAKISDLEHEKNLATESLVVEKSLWLEREKRLNEEIYELKKRVEDLDAQNILLHNQIQELSEQAAILQSQQKSSTNDIHNLNISIESTNRDILDDGSKSVEQLLQIIKYVRREKDLAVAKFDVLKSENCRLKSQIELAEKCCEETKRLLDREREHTEIDIVTTSKHSELLRKVETLNAITDSNRLLREERDSLNQNIKNLMNKLNVLSDEITPLREKSRNLESKNDTLQQENNSLKAEAMRWRQRANNLVERSNKASPEDWRRLQTERENLSKLLTSEREIHSKRADELNSLKAEKNKLEEQSNQMQRQLKLQEEQVNKLIEENRKLNLKLNDTLVDLNENEKNLINLKKEFAEKDSLLSDVKNKEIQIRKIAKKYKTQYEELSKNMVEEKSRADGQFVESKLTNEDDLQISHDRESQIREEIRMQNRQANSELSSKIDELNHQLLVMQTESENLKKEIDIINKASLEKEERAKQVLKGARTKIMQLTEYKKLCEKEMHELKEKLDSSNSEYEANINEYEARLAALKSQMEGRIQRLEHERIDLQSDKENLLQRATQLQRQLTGQSNLGTGVSEPPTANIKPMSARAETPLASIRPMSVVVQSRTAAVLPTTAGAPLLLTSQQSQQQLVHTTETSSPTSSHMDYQPASTSRQVLLQPQVSDTAESTQREETEAVEPINTQQQQQCQQLTVALVIPRVEQQLQLQQQQTQILSNDQQQTVPSSSTQSVSTSHSAISHKRPRSLDSSLSISNTNENLDNPRQEPISSPKTKRNRQEISPTQTSTSDIEYQVPTSSQRDQDEEGEDGCIVVDCDEGGVHHHQDEEEFDNDPYEEMEEEEIPYGVEVEGDNNEVDAIPEQLATTEPSRQVQSGISIHQQQQSETISSAGHTTEPSTFTRLSRGIAPLSRQQPQQHLLLPQQTYEDGGDDCIVPSTPTLFVPRRNDGFGEAVSSPQTPQNRFTFGDPSTPASVSLIQPQATPIVTGVRAVFNPACSGVAQVVQEGMDDTQIDLSQLEGSNLEQNDTYNAEQISPVEPLESNSDDHASKHDTGASISTDTHSSISRSSEIANSSSINLPCTTESEDNRIEIITDSQDSPSTDTDLKNNQKLQTCGESVSASREDSNDTETEISEDPADELLVCHTKDDNREAEASPSSNTRQRSMAAAAGVSGTTVLNIRGATAKRSSRAAFRSTRGTRPTPIVWDSQSSQREQGVVRGHPTRGTTNEMMRARGARSRRMRSKYPYNY